MIKVREWIPHKGFLTKVIPLKLFLDMVPSSFADITHTIRRQAKRLSRNYPRRNCGNVIVHVLILFYIRHVFYPLTRLFVRPGFRLLVPVWLCIIWRVKLSKRNGNGNEYNDCSSVHGNSLFISLLMFTKGHKTTTRNSHILHIQENVNYATVNF